jgi:DNA-binding LacI/PurR family transcriptional regulator
MGEFRSAGIRIPEELSLIGYDNLPMCDLPGIELTSVGQQRENIGIRSAEMAIAFAENRPYPRQIFLEPSIAERKTVKRIEVEKKDK